MDPAIAINVLQQLAFGRDPVSGNSFPTHSPYHHPDIIRALMLAINALRERDLELDCEEEEKESEENESASEEEEAPQDIEVQEVETSVEAAENELEFFSPADVELYECLRRWRRAEAQEERVPIYWIADNRMLRDLVRFLPKSIVELDEIRGFGPKKVAKYGEAILGILASASASESTSSAARQSDSCGDSVENNDSLQLQSDQQISAQPAEKSNADIGFAFADLTFIAIPCQNCGKPIHPERLEAIPDTQVCTACQHLREIAPKDWHRPADATCPRCAGKGFHSQLVWRTARDPEIPGYFLGCSRFPLCRYTE